MKLFFLYITVIISITSCKKFVDIDPPTTQLVSETVFAKDQTAIAAQLAIYARMEGDGLVYQQIIYPGLSADEFSNYSTGIFSIDLANNNLTSENSIVLNFWTNYYKYIYQANAVIEGVSNSATISETVRQQLLGESRFVRAFCHYYLTCLFGDIPIVRNTDYRINSQLSRSPVTTVLDFIEQDLMAAISLLSTSYLDAGNLPSTEKVRPNKHTAQALLARLYLLKGQWDKAEESASAVLSGNYQLISNLDNVFLKNSNEAIWQLQNVVPGYNSYPGAQLILTTTPNVVALDTNFVKTFVATDKRRLQWVKSITVSGRTYYYPFKYKVRQNASSITEYSMIFRLSELFLLRAEARSRLGDLNGAHADLNQIRIRAGLPALSGLTGTVLIDSIIQERKFELFAESGDRWLTLKRTGEVNNVLPLIKGSNWNSTDALYPIPLAEILKNNQLIQNPGY